MPDTRYHVTPTPAHEVEKTSFCTELMMKLDPVKSGDWPGQGTWLLQAATHALRCFSSSSPRYRGTHPVPSEFPLQSPCVTRGQGHFLGNKDKPVVPTEIIHCRGIVWIKLDFCTQVPGRLVGVTVTMKTMRRFCFPKSSPSNILSSGVLPSRAVRALWAATQRGIWGPCLCALGTSQDLEHILGFSFDLTSRM